MLVVRRVARSLWIGLVCATVWLGIESSSHAQTPSWKILPTHTSYHSGGTAHTENRKEKTSASTVFSHSYEKAARLGVLGLFGTATNPMPWEHKWGTLSQGIQMGEPWFWSSYLSAPFFVGGVILLIANLAILFDNYAMEVYLGWGIAGIVWGVLGTTASIIALILDLSNTRTGLTPDPIPNIIAFNVINAALQLSVVGLGIAAIIRSRKPGDPGQLTWAPWIKPDQDGHVQVGVMIQGRF